MRPQRYYWLNLLNLYFSPIGTAEFRPHEGSTNSTKILIWMLICASILRYAEDVKRCLTVSSLSIKDVLLENLDSEYTEYIMSYLRLRNETFFTTSGRYRDDVKAIEAKWFKEDSDFKFVIEKMEIK